MSRTLRLLAFSILVLSSGPTLAHSGGTDAQGGHYDRRTGEYHFHHGMGPHDHPDGVCPYGSASIVSRRAPSRPAPSSSSWMPVIVTAAVIAIVGAYQLGRMNRSVR